MNPNVNQIRDKLFERGLKVTPQRIAVLEAIYTLNNHPSAEMILEYIKETHPGIATATIYKVLDALIEKQLIKRVKTERDVMRYDGILENHHHLYCVDTAVIKDYLNDELDQLLKDYFKKKGIENFEIEEITLQINGKFSKSAKTE